MTDIVERLRELADGANAHTIGELWNGLDEAADEIERLQARIAELEAQLVTERNAKADAIHSAAMANIELEMQPEYSGWYCAQCERGVDPSEVTFNESHTECGRIITNDRPPALTATGGRDELLDALSSAAQSLETISRQAGRDEFMAGMDDVRAYANSRARVAREALAADQPAQEKQL